MSLSSTRVGKKSTKQNSTFRVYQRANLRQRAAHLSAESTLARETTYVCAFRTRKDAVAHVKESGETDNVYLIEHWINGKRINREHRTCYCATCDLCKIWNSTFTVKMAHDGRRWKETNYTLAAERAEKT